MNNTTPSTSPKVGELYLITIGDEQLRAMRTTDTSLPWVAEDGALYADEIATIVRRLVVTDPGEELETAGPEIDIRDLESGYIEIDGRAWVPSVEYEMLASKITEAGDRLAALTKAAEFTRSDGRAPFKLTQTPEHAQTHRVVEAAKWVLTGE